MSQDIQRSIKKWTLICKNTDMNEQEIRNNIDKVIFPLIAKYQSLSIQFWRDYIDQVEDHDLWGLLSEFQDLNQDFIYEYRDRLDWGKLVRWQKLTDYYTPRNQSRISNVSLDSEYRFQIPKTAIGLTKKEILKLSSFDIESDEISTNNKTYSIDNVTDNNEFIYICTNTSYNLSSTEPGFLFLNDTGTGESTTSFIEDPVISSYIRINKDLNSPFLEGFLKGQILSYSYIINNFSYMDIKDLSSHQYLTDYFIMKYDTRSIFHDSVPLIEFNWDKLTIWQRFTEILKEPNFSSWIEPLINYQLLLIYQNLSKDFIFSHLEKLQKSKLGRYNKNLSDEDLLQIQSDSQELFQTTEREESVKFNYPYDEIITDLKSSDFQFDGSMIIGYVQYDRNGRVYYNNKINFINDNDFKILQVDLDEDNMNSPSGLTIFKEKDISSDTRRRYKTKIVKVPIIGRNIDTNSTGSINISSKGDFVNYDRLLVPDGNTKVLFETDLDGNLDRKVIEIFDSLDFNSSSVSNSIITSKNHHLKTGTKISFSGSIPIPLQPDTIYYVVKVSENEFRVSLTVNDSVNGVVINIETGSGTVHREDNRFSMNETEVYYNGIPFYFEDSGSDDVSPLNKGEDSVYYLSKIDKETFKFSVTESDARSSIFVDLENPILDQNIIIPSILLNIRSDSLSNSKYLSRVFQRSISNLYEVVMTTDTDPIIIDPFYKDIKDNVITNFIDYESTFTATSETNTLTLDSVIPINTTDPISLTGSLPSPLSPGTVYYAIRINDTQFELAFTESDSESRIPISLTSDGSGSIFPLRIDLTDDISINTGNRVQVSSSTLPIPLNDSDVYYVHKISPKRMELCLTLEDAFNGVPITIQKSGNDPKTVNFSDYNIDNGSGVKGIVHFKTPKKLYIEFIGPEIFQVGDTISSREIVDSRTVYSINKILSMDCSVSDSQLSVTSTLSSSEKSKGNVLIESYTQNPKSITSFGMIGGYDDVISDSNAVGVACVLQKNGSLRSFSGNLH